jgi:hypothetical protein
MRTFKLLVLAPVATVAIASAQPGASPPLGDPNQPPAAAPIAAQPAASTVDPGVSEDANAGRSWLMPTALTPPAGTWSFSDFELLVVGIGYSPTDQLSLSLTTLLPLTDDFPLLLLANAKLQVIRSGHLRVALQGGLAHFREDLDGEATSSATAGDLGAVATLCLDDECHSHLSGFLGAGFAREDQSAVPFLFGGSVAYRLGRHVKLLVEADSGFVAGEVDAVADGFLLWYGVRFTSRNIGVDLALVKPICGSDCDGGLVLGFPFVSFTFRSIAGGG